MWSWFQFSFTVHFILVDLYLVTACLMWPYFNTPLKGHIRHIWLYLIKLISETRRGTKVNIYIFIVLLLIKKSVCFTLSIDNHICITGDKNVRAILGDSIYNMPMRRTGNRGNVDHLRNGRFEIIPLAYRMGKIFMSKLCGSWLRWSNDRGKYTTFRFREIAEDGRRYFHIISDDFPTYYVTMGMFSWYVRCTKGDPRGVIDDTWDIQILDYHYEDCYILCTRDGNYMSADCSQRIHGKRGGIDERRMFFIRQIN